MKHLLIALLILALCLSFCIWSGSYVRRAVAEPLNTLRLARTHAEGGDFDRAYDAVELAAQQWHSREALYCVLLHHDETDCVQRDLAALREQARRGEGDDFADTCAQLITQLQHLRALQLPSAGNIF